MEYIPKGMTMLGYFNLENFKRETELLAEKNQREAVELSQFELETALIEKGVL